jgi:hypothetical protein
MTFFQNLARGIVLAALAWSGAAGADAVSDWSVIANGAVPLGRAGPIGIQDLALVQAAVHDAVQSYEHRFEPFYVSVPGAKGSKSAAVGAAAHGVLVAFYPAQAATLDATYGTWLANNGLTGNAGIAVGEEVAARIATLRRLDPVPLTTFTGGTEIGQWRPTESFLGGPPPGPPPSFAPMHSPWMADFHPYVLTGPARFRAPPPPELTSDKYTKDYNEVKALGALTGSTRTPAQTDIAYFWTDNFAAQWNRAAVALLDKRRPDNLGNRARLLALMNLAIADAVVTAWDSKRYYFYWRPMTAIREGENDGNPDTAGDPTWQPLINNPNYPDYTSGANNVTGAATKMMELFFGRDDIPVTVTSNAPAAIKKTRTFSSFTAASQQVVNARVYLGIHFRTADVEARKQGRAVAEYVYDHALLPISN